MSQNEEKQTSEEPEVPKKKASLFDRQSDPEAKKLAKLHVEWEVAHPNNPPRSAEAFQIEAYSVCRVGAPKASEFYKAMEADRLRWIQENGSGDAGYLRHLVRRFDLAKDLHEDPNGPLYRPDRKGGTKNG